MNYKITKDKINDIIYKMISEEYPLDKVKVHWANSIISPYAEISFPSPDGGHYLIAFTILPKEYCEEFYKDYKTHFDKVNDRIDKAPILEFDNKSFVSNMDGIFSYRWRPIFEKWFRDNFDIEVKTFEYY